MGHPSEDIECRDSLDLGETASFLQQPKLTKDYSRRSTVCNALCVLSWISTAVLNVVAVVIIIRFYKSSPAMGSEASGYAPSFSPQIVRFQPQLETYTLNYTSKEESAAVRQRWQDLLPKGGGDVHIPDPQGHDLLSEPWIDPAGRTLWKVSWAHQLHCLYLIMNDYDRVIRYGPTGNEAQVESGHFQVHTNHCFDYLRQAIMCNADMTLEGHVLGREAAPGTDGWGHAHVCRNDMEVRRWIEERRVKDKAFIIDPDAPL